LNGLSSEARVIAPFLFARMEVPDLGSPGCGGIGQRKSVNVEALRVGKSGKVEAPGFSAVNTTRLKLGL